MTAAPTLSKDATDATGVAFLGGALVWIPRFAAAGPAAAWFDALFEETPWVQPRVRLFGRELPSPRLAAWFGDPGAAYTYSGLRNEPLPFSPTLAAIRQAVEAALGESFNSVLLNLYRSGDDAMGWHSDDEPELDARASIASLSLGGPRNFRLRHKRHRHWRIEIPLAGGALLVMKPPFQDEWSHAVPRERRPLPPRINLTFRKIR